MTTAKVPLVLGLDVGTSTTKAVIADPTGRTLWTETVSHYYSTPHPGWVEQEPEDWWHAVGSVTRALLKKHPSARDRIAAVGVSGQGVAAALLDASGHPLRPAILWLDLRSSSQAARLNQEVGDRIARISGKCPAAYNVEPKLLWIRENEPAVWERVWKVMTTTAYVTFRLTGRPVMNYSDAGVLLGYDLAQNCWSQEALDLMGLPRSLYCDLAPCDQVIGAVTEEASRLTGLRPGTLVIAGGEDTSSAGVAVGVVTPQEALLSMGTACTIFVPIPKVNTDPRLLAFPHVIDGLTLMGGSMVAGGSVMDWLAKLLDPSQGNGTQQSAEFLEELTREAQDVQAGAGGIVFLPYLAGELQPINDGFARGVFFGLSLATRRAQLVRAVLEGTGFAIRHNLEVTRTQGANPRRLIAVGGPTRNSLWCQVIADVTGLPVQVMDERGGAALGDAFLAAKGVGLISSCLEMSDAYAVRTDLFEPRTELRLGYERLFQTYGKLYPLLKDLFRSLGPEGPNSSEPAGA